MLEMTEQVLCEFAHGYSPSDFKHIEFTWDERLGEGLEDPNMGFRMELCECIKDRLEEYSDQLIIDLYMELAKSSVETWGVYEDFHLFANEILSRGGARYFEQYLEGASQSMDTSMSSGELELEPDTIDEILTYIKDRLSGTPDDDGYGYMLERFERLKEQAKE